MFKKEEGITLVALVITIIVLLILAGVSISLVVGNNGVLTQASQAVVTNNQATAKQDIEMAVAGVYTLYMGEWANNTNLKFVEGSTPYLTVTRLQDNRTDTGANFGGTVEWDDTNKVLSGFTYTKDNLTINFTVNAQGKVAYGTITGE